MNEKRLSFGLAVAVTAAIIALRIFGILPDAWLAFGLIILVWIWHFLLSTFPDFKRLINWGFGLMVVYALATTIGANVWHNIIAPNTPMTRAASERAGVAADSGLASWLNPTMLKAKLAAKSSQQELEDIVGDQFQVEYKKINSELQQGLISPEEALAKKTALAQRQTALEAKSREVLEVKTTAHAAPAQPAASLAATAVVLLDTGYTLEPGSKLTAAILGDKTPKEWIVVSENGHSIAYGWPPSERSRYVANGSTENIKVFLRVPAGTTKEDFMFALSVDNPSFTPASYEADTKINQRECLLDN